MKRPRAAKLYRPGASWNAPPDFVCTKAEFDEVRAVLFEWADLVWWIKWWSGQEPGS